MMAGQVPQ